MVSVNIGRIEERTQEIGRRLYGLLREQRSAPSDRVQDWLMVRLMEQPELRTRMLRFVDVMAGLPEGARRARWPPCCGSTSRTRRTGYRSS